MDIGMFNALQINQVQNPFSATPGNARLGTSDPSAFEDLLRRAQATPGSGTQVSAGLPPVVKDPELYEVCLELETILIKNLLTGMRSTIMKSNLIETGFAGEIYEDMLYDEYAKMMARNASLGFAEMAYRELSGLPQTL
ncbi:MAG: rod-binding protein [Treponema sp.]|nr:rod-binding protein [Treponema sp.]